MAQVQRIFVVVLENTNADLAIRQPYLASLAASGALLRNYHAIAHPSLPNYIAMAAGSSFAIADDNPITLDVSHLGDLLDAAGVSWKVYAEDYPGGCYLGTSFSDGDAGQYVRRHVPFIAFTDVQSNPDRCGRIVPAERLDGDVATGSLPRFAMYVPDTVNDGHDTGVAFADAWLRSRFQSLLADPNFTTGLLFIVVFDEATTDPANAVYCSLSGAGIRPGAVSDAQYDHYSLLRTIEELFHCGTLHRNDAAAAMISDVWIP